MSSDDTSNNTVTDIWDYNELAAEKEEEEAAEEEVSDDDTKISIDLYLGVWGVAQSMIAVSGALIY